MNLGSEPVLFKLSKSSSLLRDCHEQVSQKTNSLLSGLNSYYEKAAGTPTGQTLVNFYSQTQKQVLDIHKEAARLAELKKQEVRSSWRYCLTHHDNIKARPFLLLIILPILTR